VVHLAIDFHARSTARNLKLTARREGKSVGGWAGRLYLHNQPMLMPFEYLDVLLFSG
jgi:hypothetical protein